ncbi:MAG TPA: HD domain-containing phosphohydrolase [Xanthobacteraceae bacterium]
MDRLSVISDSVDRAEIIGRQLAGMFVTQSFVRNGFSHATPAKYTIVDIDLEDSSHLLDLRRWLELRPNRGKAVFVVEHGVRRQVAQAFAIGATDLVDRPIDRKALLTALLGEIGSLASDPAAFSIGTSDGISAGIGALQSIFASAVSGIPVDLNMVRAASETVVSHIEAEGLVRWIDIVRQHHSLTYQHCLLVTGVAVTFGRHLGFSSGDKRKLAFAGLLHDIGKAGVPVALLEKPGPLEGDEVSVMRHHPQLGFEALRGVLGLDPDMLDMVVHHHEYLDGSGYPHGLAGSELSDLVRMMTIADVFGALIERRAYRAASTCESAYQVLEDMGPKLDADLVRAFRPFAHTRIG